MMSSKAKAKAVSGGTSATHRPGGITKNNKKQKQADVETKKQAIRDKIQDCEEKKRKKENGDDQYKDVEMGDIEEELKMHQETLTLLDKEGDTIMSPDDEVEEVDGSGTAVEASGGGPAGEIPKIVFTNTLGNKEPAIKQENGVSQSLVFNKSEDPEDLVAPEDVLGDDPLTDGVPVGWRPGGRGRDMVIVQWGPPNSRVYKEVPAAYAPSGFNKQKSICLADNRYGERKSGGVYEFTKQNKPVLQGVAFAYPSTEEHPERLLHPDTKPKRYLPGSYKIKWTMDGITDTSWETRTTVRRVWGSNAKRADLAIWEAFTKAQARHNEWKQGERKAEDRSPTPDPRLEAPPNTASPSPQPGPEAQSISTSPEPIQNLAPQTANKPAQQIKFGQTSQPIQQATPESTPEPAQKETGAGTQASKSMNFEQEQEQAARRAFMEMMLDTMKIDGEPTLQQLQSVAMQWAILKKDQVPL